jgi:hypothetical protein
MIQQAPSARPGSIEKIKEELIGRRNEFIARQELDAKRRQVVPAAKAGQVESLRVVERDWQRGKLIFHLNRAPEPAWINSFRNPRGTWSGIMGAGPQNFTFSGNTATVPADEMDFERIVGYFNQYLEMATRGYQQDLDETAQRADYEKREELKRELAEVERRAQILAKLNKI